jgi:hypothetical protein
MRQIRLAKLSQGKKERERERERDKEREKKGWSLV